MDEHPDERGNAVASALTLLMKPCRSVDRPEQVGKSRPRWLRTAAATEVSHLVAEYSHAEEARKVQVFR